MWRIVTPEGIATIAAVVIVSLLYVGYQYMPSISLETGVQILEWMLLLLILLLAVGFFRQLILTVFFDTKTPETKKD